MAIILDRTATNILVAFGNNALEARAQALRAEQVVLAGEQAFAESGAVFLAQAEERVAQAKAWADDAANSVVQANTVLANGEERISALEEAAVASFAGKADDQIARAQAWAQAAEASAAVAEAFDGPTYADLAEGLAATAEGGSFAVAADGVVTIYSNEAGSATPLRSLATTQALASTTGANLSGVGMDATFASGTVGGHLRWSPLPQDAPWLCDATGSVDCTQALQAYFDYCAENDLPARLKGRYLTSATIQSSVRAILGEVAYQNGQGTRITMVWDPETMEDLTPVISLNTNMAGDGAVVKNVAFQADGSQAFTMLDAETWCPNPELLPTLDAFLPGPVGVLVTGGSRPTFDNCNARQIKIGIMYDQKGGHVSCTGCGWSGWLAGLYVKRNTEDYNFYAGSIQGIFAGVILGVDGATCFMHQVHMGFSAYGFYQVEDGANDGVNYLPGLGGIYRVNLEQIGECAIKLLPNAVTSALKVERWGFSWSSVHTDWENTSANGWAYNLHPHIKPYAEQQQYALQLGVVYPTNILVNEGHGNLFKSSNRADSAIAYVASFPIFETKLTADCTAFGQDVVFGGPRRTRWYSRYGARVTTGDLQVASAILPPNLLKNPEDPANWTGTAPGLVTLADVAKVYPQQMIDELGSDPVVLSLAPGATSYIQPAGGSLGPEAGRIIGYSCWTTGGKALRRINRTSNNIYYHNPAPEEAWTKHVYFGEDHAEAIADLVFAVNSSAGEPLYLAGLMLFLDEVKPYNSSPSIRLQGLADSADGLPSGSLWNNAGVLSIA